MLDLLTPSELTLNLTRIYVYNMNSAFRLVISVSWSFASWLIKYVQEMLSTPFAGIYKN